MYLVLKAFKDRTDKKRLYAEGKKYPRRNLKPTEERIDELKKLGFIKEV